MLPKQLGEVAIFGAVPKIGYHVTYKDRLPSILKEGLKRKLPAKLRTGFGADNLIFFINSPEKAEWAAKDRNLDTKKELVLLKIFNLNPKLLRADPDFENDSLNWEASFNRAGTFAYDADVSPSQIKVVKFF